MWFFYVDSVQFRFQFGGRAWKKASFLGVDNCFILRLLESHDFDLNLDLNAYTLWIYRCFTVLVNTYLLLFIGFAALICRRCLGFRI